MKSNIQLPILAAFCALITISASGNGTKLDFSGDGISDLALYNPATGGWFIQNATNNVIIAWNLPHGYPGAECVSGDFNGDSEADLGVYDPISGRWYIRTLDGEQIVWGLQWGFPTGEPVIADFNGDGADDLGIYDTATALWYVLSVGGDVIYWAFNWGYPGCEPLAGVYSGTAATPTVFDDKIGRFWIPGQAPRDIFTFGFEEEPDPFKTDSEAEPISGDHTGNGLTDLTVYDPIVGFWQVWKNEFLTDFIEWGFIGGIPVEGDYDGDGITDFAVYAGGYWFIRANGGDIIKFNHNWGGYGLVPAGRRMANPAVDTSTIRFSDDSAAYNIIQINLQDLERGTLINPPPGSTLPVQPGWYRATVYWYGSVYQGGVEWFLPGTNIYNISVEPRRTYNYQVTGGAINPPKAIAPATSFAEQ